MKRLAAVALAMAVFVPAAPAPAQTEPHAEAAAVYLTMREAKREIHREARRRAREAGTRLESIDIFDCRRFSRRRIRCFVYRVASDGLNAMATCG